MSVREASEIFRDIRNSFADKIGDEPGTVLDFFAMAVAEADADIYQEIEKNKTPHIWSALTGETLDDTGTWLNCPRDPGESDASYSYRLMRWMLRNESCNETAISTYLLNPQQASDISFVPLTNGCGTGTCYIIPKSYSEDDIAAALVEAKERIRKIASPTTYIEYIIPEMRSVSMEIYIESEHGDIDAIKSKIENEIRAYINAIPPKQYLSAGEINRIGIGTSTIDYFSVLSIIINGKPIDTTKILQQVESKFIFSSISWVGGD